MANPQVHARSSARKFGGRWQEFIEVHSFMDSSKLHFAKATHRALLHHEYGVELAIGIFGDCGRLPGTLAAIKDIVSQHLAEDFTKEVPTVADWFADSTFETKPAIGLAVACAESVRHFGGKPEDYLPVHDFLDGIEARYPDVPAAWGITHSTFGLGLCEMVLGWTVGPREVPVRTVAEKHILLQCGGVIPSTYEVLNAIPIRPWMYNQAAALSRELDKALV